MNKLILLLMAITMIASYSLEAQVSINTDGSAPNASAMLDVKSNNKGFLLPRLSVVDIAAIINPADGLQVYNTTDGKLYIYVTVLGKWRQLDYGMSSLSSDCGFPITDARDGKTYNTVLIGSQCWMAENINIGIRIDGQYDQFNNGLIEKYCYNDDTLNCDTYGALYQWAEVVQYLNGATNTTSWSPVPTGNVQGICPAGWHLPTDDEWKTLEMIIGMSQSVADQTSWRGTEEGSKLKEVGTTHWNSPNAYATNASGFTALPAGYHDGTEPFNLLGNAGYWWSSTENSDTQTWVRTVVYDHGQVFRGLNNKSLGFSVRCLKN